MLKKFVALFIILAMLVPFSSVVAADEPSAPPTVEEILSQYHQKSYAAQQSPETAAASAYSRSASGSGKTLEQETVEQLTDAGYEAYNVTAENYNALEESLKTDFSELGLDPNGSYIIVIEGEDSADANYGVAPAASDLLLPPHVWDGDQPTGGSSFVYEYNGQAYIMRYLTVTGADNTELRTETIYTFNQNKSLEVLDNTLEGIFWFMASSSYGVLVDLSSVIIDSLDDDNQVDLNLNSSWLYVGTVWTYEYIEILDTETGWWNHYQYSTYAKSSGEVHLSVYNPTTGFLGSYKASIVEFVTYSPLYHQKEERKYNAAAMHFSGRVSEDSIGEITFHYTPGNKISFNQDDTPLFTQSQPPHNHTYG